MKPVGSPCGDSRSLLCTVSFAAAAFQQDEPHRLSGEPVLHAAANDDAAEHRAAPDFRARQPRLERPHVAGVVTARTRQCDVGAFAFLISFVAGMWIVTPAASMRGCRWSIAASSARRNAPEEPTRSTRGRAGRPGRSGRLRAGAKCRERSVPPPSGPGAGGGAGCRRGSLGARDDWMGMPRRAGCSLFGGGGKPVPTVHKLSNGTVIFRNNSVC